MKRKNRTVKIPRGLVTVPEDDPVRVRLEWRMGLVKYALQCKEKKSGSKEKEGN